MHVRKLIGVALVLLLIFPAVTGAGEKKETPSSLPGVEVISTDVAKTWLDNGEDVVFLDARKKTDFQTGHLPDAIQAIVPLDLDLTEETIKKSVEALKKVEDIQDLDLNQKMITYCNGST